jgi:hypothetical protein
MPLALCDFRTISPSEDFFPTARIAPNQVGETLSVKYSPRHQFQYLSEQTPDEAILIKCYDSAENVAWCTPHTAFSMPKELIKGPYKPRESIEVMRNLYFCWSVGCA